MAGGNQFRARTQQLLELAQQQVARVVDRGHLEDRSRLLRNQLPRNDIRVMLQVRDDDLVTRLQVLTPPRVRHQVDRLGGAADEHDVLRARRTDEVGDGVARLLVGVGGPGRQFVCGAVDVGVLVRVELHQPVDHHLRLLRGGGVVEPDQRLSVDDLFEDREVRPHRVDVEHLVLVGQLRHRVVGGEEVIVALIAGRRVRRDGTVPVHPSSGTDGAPVGHDGAEPRGATGTVGTPPASTPGNVGTMPSVGTANALRSAGTNGSAMPPDVAAADGPAVVSGTLPRGATGTACGGGSGSGDVGAGT